ncbi:hypothetical protein Pan110_46610 [Gimesia panareensis]|nr:hypothetical protein Pan110_46610 [Gimesia panareensis]
MEYWHICVLAAVRLGCDFTYDQLQDLAENHRKLRAVMGVGDCDDRPFKWRTIRNNIRLLRPETIARINQAIVSAGHAFDPTAIEKVRADSFVMETNIHCVNGWRQYAHLLRKIKQLNRNINRIATKKGPRYKSDSSRFTANS